MTFFTASNIRPQYGTNWMRKTLQARQARERMSTNPREELRLYLESPLEDADNIVACWGVSLFYVSFCAVLMC